MIDPNGVDTDIPTVGFSFSTFAQLGGVGQTTLSSWVDRGDQKPGVSDDPSQRLVLPFGKRV